MATARLGAAFVVLVVVSHCAHVSQAVALFSSDGLKEGGDTSTNSKLLTLLANALVVVPAAQSTAAQSTAAQSTAVQSTAGTSIDPFTAGLNNARIATFFILALLDLTIESKVLITNYKQLLQQLDHAEIAKHLSTRWQRFWYVMAGSNDSAGFSATIRELGQTFSFVVMDLLGPVDENNTRQGLGLGFGLSAVMYDTFKFISILRGPHGVQSSAWKFVVFDVVVIAVVIVGSALWANDHGSVWAITLWGIGFASLLFHFGVVYNSVLVPDANSARTSLLMHTTLAHVVDEEPKLDWVQVVTELAEPVGDTVAPDENNVVWIQQVPVLPDGNDAKEYFMHVELLNVEARHEEVDDVRSVVDQGVSIEGGLYNAGTRTITKTTGTNVVFRVGHHTYQIKERSE